MPELSVSIVSTLILPLCPVPSRHRPCLGRPSSPSLLISETLAADAPATREAVGCRLSSRRKTRSSGRPRSLPIGPSVLPTTTVIPTSRGLPIMGRGRAPPPPPHRGRDRRAPSEPVVGPGRPPPAAAAHRSSSGQYAIF